MGIKIVKNIFFYVSYSCFVIDVVTIIVVVAVVVVLIFPTCFLLQVVYSGQRRALVIPHAHV